MLILQADCRIPAHGALIANAGICRVTYLAWRARRIARNVLHRRHRSQEARRPPNGELARASASGLRSAQLSYWGCWSRTVGCRHRGCSGIHGCGCRARDRIRSGNGTCGDRPQGQCFRADLRPVRTPVVVAHPSVHTDSAGPGASPVVRGHSPEAARCWQGWVRWKHRIGRIDIRRRWSMRIDLRHRWSMRVDTRHSWAMRVDTWNSWRKGSTPAWSAPADRHPAMSADRRPD
jgi:hypothetical protein